MVVARGGVEPPTFRFSAVRCPVQTQSVSRILAGQRNDGDTGKSLNGRELRRKLRRPPRGRGPGETTTAPLGRDRPLGGRRLAPTRRVGGGADLADPPPDVVALRGVPSGGRRDGTMNAATFGAIALPPAIPETCLPGEGALYPC